MSIADESVHSEAHPPPRLAITKHHQTTRSRIRKAAFTGTPTDHTRAAHGNDADGT